MINVLVNEKGEANYNVYISEEKTTVKDSSETALRLEKIAIENTHLVYNDKSAKILIDAKGFNYVGNGDLDKSIFDLYTKAKIESFDFIARSTQLRPRDFIQYIQACAEETHNKNYPFIKEANIKFIDRAFSNYLRDEIIDEVLNMVDRSQVGGLVLTPPMSEMPEVLTALGKRKIPFGRILSGYQQPDKK